MVGASKQGPDTCPVAIIGMGCFFPRAQGVTEFWRSVRRGEDGVSEIPPTHWSIADYFDPDPKAPDKTYCKRGAFLSPIAFDPTEFGIPPTSLEATDTTQLLGLMAAKAALEDAGYGEGRDFNRERVSVVLGVTGTQELVLPLAARMGYPVWRRVLREAGVASDVAEQIVRRISDSYVSWQESSFPGLLGNVVAGRIANRLNLRGTNCVVDAACASSLAAVHLSALELANGRCDMALTGGADTFNDVFMFLCFSKTPALSPTGDARPFAEAADGTVLGEGIGMIVLKRLEDAQRDGDRIYAVLRGIGTSSDGRSQSIYAPHSAGQARALRNAYRLAGIGPESVGLIEAHGTGTRVGDASEFEALRTVFREGQSDGTWCALGSIKSQIGHTKAAAGVAGLLKAALAIYYRSLPPTIKIEQPSSKLNIQDSPFYLNTELRPWVPREGRPRRAGVSAFGFGGSNFHAVLEEHQATLPEVAWDDSVELIALGAPSIQNVVEQVDSWRAAVTDNRWNGQELAYRAAASRRVFSPASEHRLVILAVRGGDFTGLLERVRERLTAGSAAAASSSPGWSLPDAFYGQGAADGKVAFLFPGQGSQYVGMGLDLACTFPEMSAVLVEAETIGQRAGGGEPRLSDAIYPPPVFDEGERERQSAVLRRTEIVQPALGAVSLAMCRILGRFGVRPDVVAGHSYGELVALCVAGRFDGETLHTLSRLRGRLMAEGDGDRGTMLAVKAPLAELEKLVTAQAPDVVIANRNAPNQGILSGPREAIGKALRACQSLGFATKALAVSGAFHSRLMEGAVGPFRQALESMAFQPGAIPVYANATGEAYPGDAAEARALLGRQLIMPVEFVREVESLYAAGARTFVEVGPRSVLTGLVKAILGAHSHQAVALDSSAGRASGMLDLARVLASLAAAGRSLDLSAWGRAVPEPRKPRMIIPLVGANYRASRSTNVEEMAPPAVNAGAVVREAGPPEVAADELESVPATVFASAAESPPQSAPAGVVEELSDVTMSPAPAGAPAPAGHGVEPVFAPSAPTPSERKASIEPNGPQAISSVPPAAPAGLRSATPPLGATGTPQTAHVIAEGLRAMQRLQQQTAEIHQRFLEVQAQAHTALLRLMTGQQQALEPSLGSRSVAPVETSIVPRPVPRFEAPYAAPAAAPPPAVIRPAAAAGPSVAPARPTQSEGSSLAEIAPQPVMPVSAPAAGQEFGKVAEVAAVPARKVEAPSPARDALPTAPMPGAPEKAEALVLDVVCEKTGYPREMIELDMDIEADLGIDSIKRVEIMAAIEERAPQWGGVRPDQMGGLRTLREITALLGANLPEAPATGTPSERPEVVQPVSRAAEVQPEPVAPPVAAVTPVRSIPAPTPAPDAATGSGAPFAQGLLQVVAQLTGYPIEMLNLDMDMEADLGIDSIKRVEILAALEARLPQMPPVKPDQMGSLRTLRQIVESCAGPEPAAQPHTEAAPKETAPSGPVVPAAAPSIPPPGAPVPELAGAAVEQLNNLDSPVVIRRSVLTASELPALAAIPQAGIQCPRGSEVWVTDDGTDLSRALIASLIACGCSARLVQLDAPQTWAGITPSAVGQTAAPPVGGLILVARPASAPALPWDEQSERWLKSAFDLTKAVAPSLRSAGLQGGAFLATVSRLDGAFGLRGGRFDPVQGGLAALAKTAGQEWTDVRCRAIDVALSWMDARAIAEAVVRELATDGPPEVGLDRDRRCGLQLTEASATASLPRLASGDVVLVTGGARGVTAACLESLARACRPTLVIIGRSALTQDEPAWLVGLEDEAAIKQAILQHSADLVATQRKTAAGDPGADTASTSRKPLTPAELQAVFARLIAERETRRNLRRIAAAGARVVYRALDVRDAAAVQALVSAVQAKLGPVRAVVHAAGVLADRLIAEKTPEQFTRVFDTKVVGLRNLLAALPLQELRRVVLFSSVSARFGNAGQVDYAMANEVLNKAAQRLATELPDCGIVSINWGPWDGGMVTPVLRREFQRQGVALLPIEAGAQRFVAELNSASRGAVEVVISAEGRGARIPQGRDADRPRDSLPAGSSPAAAVAPPAAAERPVEDDLPAMPVAGGESALTLAFERKLDLDRHAFLRSHVIDGRPVLPVALMIEWLGHAAVHANPGLMLHGVDDLRVLKGVVLRDEAPMLRFLVGPARRKGTFFEVSAELRGRAGGPPERGASAPNSFLHARATILLAASMPPAPSLTVPDSICDRRYDRGVQGAYDDVLFHGEHFRGIEEVVGYSSMGLVARLKPAPAPAKWMADPMRSDWLADPLALDAAFQLGVLWCYEEMAAVGLPTYLRSYRQYGSAFPRQGMRGFLQVREHAAHKMEADVTIADHAGRVAARIEGLEFTTDAALRVAFRHRSLAMPS